MLALREIGILVAEIDAFSVELILDAGDFLLTVAKRAAPLKTDHIVVSQAIFVAGRKLAENSVPNLISRADNGDGLFHQQRAVVEKSNVAVEVANAFGLCRRRGAPETKHRNDPENA